MDVVYESGWLLSVVVVVCFCVFVSGWLFSVVDMVCKSGDYLHSCGHGV